MLGFRVALDHPFSKGTEMAPQNDAEKATTKFIEDFVGKHWGNHESVCYLSSLGVHVKREVPESRSVLSEGLREFLRQNPIVQVVQFPGVKQKIGAVPLSVRLPEDIRELFEKKDSAFALKSETSYIQEFWDAFIRPIDAEPRFVCIDTDGDVQIGEGMTDATYINCYEVLKQDLTTKVSGGSIADRVAATHSAIDAWLTKHSLDPKVFFLENTRRRDVRKGDRLSAFLDAFDGLSHEDLARIEIPLDILIKLNIGK